MQPLGITRRTQKLHREAATIGGTMDTPVPVARSPYKGIRDSGLPNSGRPACGAFLIRTKEDGTHFALVE